MILHARAIARFILESKDYQLLPANVYAQGKNSGLDSIFNIVFFRVRGEGLTERLQRFLSERDDIFVSGTVWEGKPAIRIAVSNWRASREEDAIGGWGPVVKALALLNSRRGWAGGPTCQ